MDDTSSNDRVVEHEYDWRDRLVTTITDDGTYVVNTVSTLDNLGRATAVEDKRDDSGNLVLIGKRETKYDTRGRVYRTLRYAVSDSGTVGNSLADNTWYDAGDNVLKSQPAGSQRFTKTVYDALSRPTNTYTGVLQRDRNGRSGIADRQRDFRGVGLELRRRGQPDACHHQAEIP